MYNMFFVLLACIAAMMITLFLTPLVKRIAIRIGAMDKPSQRRVNLSEMPTLGGIAIYASFFFSLYFLVPVPEQQVTPIFLGATVILFTGILDDLIELKPRYKVLGIVLASLIVYYFGDTQLDMITLPMIGEIQFGGWSLPFTILWILAFTNAINLIDGLDGLATGVSVIALTTMGIIGFFFLTIEDVAVSIMIFILTAAAAGFLPFNFYPASIFLGDTGALFLGFMISVMSLEGLKNATLITLLMPIVILGIPITDTIYAMIRRFLNKQAISTADKHHIHHRLMSIGLTHRQTVLAIYCLAGAFSIIALLYPISTFWGSILLTIAVLYGIELFVEIIGLVGENRQPLLRRLRKFAWRLNKRNPKE